MKRERAGDTKQAVAAKGNEEDRDVAVPVKLVHVVPRHVLSKFYRTIFSTVMSDVIWGLGTCGGRFELLQREMDLVVDTAQGESFHVRNDVYQTLPEFTERLLRICPTSIHFGPIFPGHHLKNQSVVAPKLDAVFGSNRHMALPRYFERYSGFKTECAAPLGEMVIDIDMCDAYDRTGICNCGKAKKVCDTCWSVYLDPAQLVMDHIYAYFGLTAKFRVFSGRRGFHDWLINKRMIYMTGPQRVAFIKAIQWQNLVPGSDLYVDIFNILEPLFDANKVLTSRYPLPLAGVAKRQAVFSCLYPKMDVNVTNDATHLHKLPLTLHQETGNLCVLMGAVKGRNRCVPSEDSIQPDKIRPEHMLRGAEVIRKALDILKSE